VQPAEQAKLALKEMRSDLSEFIRFLKERRVVSDIGSTYSIWDALNESKEAHGTIEWKYTSGKVTLQLSNGTVVNPGQAKSLFCSFDISVEGRIHIGEPMRWEIKGTQMNLEFCAESSTVGPGWSQFWHLDTHIEDPAKPAEDPHPMFHFHFGGRQMAQRRLVKAGCWGRMLELKGPRIAHPPMDLVLATDFILSNTSGARWKKEFYNAKEYSGAVCRSQQRFWKPYKEMLADFYGCSRQEQQKHGALFLWPTLRVESL
jgi:hypothetical protein